MRFLNDLIEQSIDRIVEKKAGERIDEDINKVIEGIVRKELEIAIKEKISKCLEDSMKGIDVMLKEVKSLDGVVEGYVKKYKSEMLEKVKKATEKVEVEIDISSVQEAINKKISYAFNQFVSDNSSMFGRIIGTKSVEYVKELDIFPIKKGKSNEISS